MKRVTLREFVARAAIYEPDSVPIPLDPALQALMAQTGQTFISATGVNLILAGAFFLVGFLPLFLLSGVALVINFALAVYCQSLQTGSPSVAVITPQQLSTVNILSAVAEFYQVIGRGVRGLSVGVFNGLMLVLLVVAVLSGLGIFLAAVGGGRRR